MNYGNLSEKIIEKVAIYGPKLLLAIVVLLVGLFLINILIRIVRKAFTKTGADPSLNSFLLSLSSVLLKILLFIVIASLVGIPMASFVAILAAVGFAIGMALSGTLQNFAGGIMLLVFKPIRVGDWINAQGVEGFVSEIQSFVTILKTLDNKTVFIPNGPLSTNIITNYSIEAKRRIDLSFGISYADDIDKAKSLLLEVANENEKIVKDPIPFAEVEELGNSSVNFTLRVWVKKDDYWDVYFYLFEAVKKIFDKNDVSIPFPQRDVHIFKKN